MPRAKGYEPYHDRVIVKFGANQGLLRLADRSGLYDKQFGVFFLF